MSWRMSRREALKLIALHLAAIPSASVACGPAPPKEWELFARRAATWFDPDTLEAARVIGARFLRRVGEDRDALQAELGPTLALLGTTPRARDPMALEAAITADFQSLTVRDVDGWTLAATEAHLAALVELFGLTG